MANECDLKNEETGSLMDAVAFETGALRRALLLQQQAAEVGFDWATPEPVLGKLQEEVTELRTAMAAGDAEEMEDELGDLLFVVVNLARQLNVHPASALQRANAKFEQRFRALERLAGSRTLLYEMGLDEMEALWQRVKAGKGR